MFAKLSFASLLSAAVLNQAQSTGSGSCSDVHIFIARGWNEPYPGRQGTLVGEICANLSDRSCDYEDVVYDAASSDYCPSVLTGDANGLQQIEAYHSRCPSTALVLSGYSEGANIIGDILAGGSCGTFYGLNEASGPSCNIAAALLFGDPRHAPNQAYNVLDGAAGQGEGAARSTEQLETLDFFTPRLRSYCQKDDLVCAKGLGADTVDAHTNYFDIYTQDAASWASDRVRSFNKAQYCSVSTATSSVASTSSAASTSSGIASTTGAKASKSVVTSSAAVSSTITASTGGISNATSSPTASPSGEPVELTSTYIPSCGETGTVITTNGTSSASTWIYGTVVTTSTSPGHLPSDKPISSDVQSSAASSTVTLWSTKEITVTSCAASVTDCPANSTVVRTTSVPVSTTVHVPTTYASNDFDTTSSAALTSAFVLGSKTAVVAYSTITSTTTLWNFPTMTITKKVPVTTSFVESVSWSNGTTASPLGSSTDGTGAEWVSATASPIGPAVYTGDGTAVQAQMFSAVVAGLACIMML